MVFYLLRFSAELENLTNLQPDGGCDDPDYRHHFKVKCENCGEISQKETWVTMSETVPLPTGRGTANLVQKCKLCGREGTIQMIPGQGSPLTLEKSQAQVSTTLMVFDCRGFEPIGFSFGNGWKAESPNRGVPCRPLKEHNEDCTCYRTYALFNDVAHHDWAVSKCSKSIGGTKFGFDLSEGEFAEYDEKGECPVGISNLQATFKVAKKNERHGRTTYG